MNAKHFSGITVVAPAVQDGGGLLLADAPFTRWLPTEGVHAIGPDAWAIERPTSPRDAAPARATPRLSDLLKRKVATEGSTYVGQVASLETAGNDLAITGLEVSPGFFGSSRVVPADHMQHIGDVLVIVSDARCLPEPEPNDSGETREHRLVVGDAEPGRSRAN